MSSTQGTHRGDLSSMGRPVGGDEQGSRLERPVDRTGGAPNEPAAAGNDKEGTRVEERRFPLRGSDDDRTGAQEAGYFRTTPMTTPRTSTDSA